MGNDQSSARRRSSREEDLDDGTITSGSPTDHKSKSKKDDDASPAALFFDSVCGNLLYQDNRHSRHGNSRNRSFGDDYSDYSDDDETLDSYRPGSSSRKTRKQVASETDSFVSETTDMDTRTNNISGSKSNRRDRDRRDKYSKDEESTVGGDSIDDDSTLDSRLKNSSVSNNKSSSKNNTTSSNTGVSSTSGGTHPLDNNSVTSSTILSDTPSKSTPTTTLGKPLASSFAKRCYFTKSGIGKTTQHYEGLTLTGNTVLMLASAMKLKGCPTICDEDLRRVEKTYPNQFSRLPDELLLSSGWRRISKYCHFSSKPIPDGVPFFHSKQRLHPQTGGYYFLLASAIGMIRPFDVEPLSLDTLIVLQTDFPHQCDLAPPGLIENPDMWTLVNKFCFFSGGPINTEEDVYYEADFDGNAIFMLAFLSPSLTPEELYRLSDDTDGAGNGGLRTTRAVEEVESVYNLTERDFDDLKLYHLGPCRALPSYVLSPAAWKKVLPRHFLEAREKALARAFEIEVREGTGGASQQQSHQEQQQSGVVGINGYGGGSNMLANQQQQNAGGYVEFGGGQNPQQHHQDMEYGSYSRSPPPDQNQSWQQSHTHQQSQQQPQQQIHQYGQQGMEQQQGYGTSPHQQQQDSVGMNGYYGQQGMSSQQQHQGHTDGHYLQQGLQGQQQHQQFVPPQQHPSPVPQRQPSPLPHNRAPSPGSLAPSPNPLRVNSPSPSYGMQQQRAASPLPPRPNERSTSPNVFSFYDPNVGLTPGSNTAHANGLDPEPQALNDNQMKAYGELQREVEEEGAFVTSVNNSQPIDEAIARAASESGAQVVMPSLSFESNSKPDPAGATLSPQIRMDPPEEDPPEEDDYDPPQEEIEPPRMSKSPRNHGGSASYRSEQSPLRQNKYDGDGPGKILPESPDDESDRIDISSTPDSSEKYTRKEDTLFDESKSAAPSPPAATDSTTRESPTTVSTKSRSASPIIARYLATKSPKEQGSTKSGGSSIIRSPKSQPSFSRTPEKTRRDLNGSNRKPPSTAGSLRSRKSHPVSSEESTKSSSHQVFFPRDKSGGSKNEDTNIYESNSASYEFSEVKPAQRQLNYENEHDVSSFDGGNHPPQTDRYGTTNDEDDTIQEYHDQEKGMNDIQQSVSGEDNNTLWDDTYNKNPEYLPQQEDQDDATWDDQYRREDFSPNADKSHNKGWDDEGYIKEDYSPQQENFSPESMNAGSYGKDFGHDPYEKTTKGEWDNQYRDDYSAGGSTLESSPEKDYRNPDVSSPNSTGGGRSVVSEYSKSSAMRGAQELLRKNRQKRLALMANRKRSSKDSISLTGEDDQSVMTRDESVMSASSAGKSALISRNRARYTSPSHYSSPPSDYVSSQARNFSRSEMSEGVKDWNDDASVSDATSQVSGSSVWTDNTNPKERSSRRLLILQMAKNRMKSSRSRSGTSVTSGSKGRTPKHSPSASSPPKQLRSPQDSTPVIEEEDYSVNEYPKPTSPQGMESDYSIGAGDLD